MFSDLKRSWEKDWLNVLLTACWVLTVFFSFFGDVLVSVQVRPFGEVFPFRVFLGLTALLYVIRVFTGGDCFWHDTTPLEWWVYGCIVILLVYGAVSLPRALEVSWTFKQLFNLVLDLMFFFLGLRLCRRRSVLKISVWTSAAAAAILSVAGVYEIFNGGIFSDKWDKIRIFDFLMGTYQSPAVSFVNANDYCVSLAFLAGIYLLLWYGRGMQDRARLWWVPTVSLPVVYFLSMAASSRLVLLSCYILLAALILVALVQRRKLVRVPVVILALMLVFNFCQQYRNIVPPVVEYAQAMHEYRLSNDPTAEKPKFHWGSGENHSPSEFFTVDEGGNKVLRSDNSSGVRVRLLLHAVGCFKESHGMGVGLGNTEILARQLQVARPWSIHCFIARLIGDFGIFVLIPMCAIGFLLAKYGVSLLRRGLRERDTDRIGEAILFLAVLLTYPLLSTVPSDAQDLIAMWLYLAIVMLLGDGIRAKLMPGRSL